MIISKGKPKIKNNDLSEDEIDDVETITRDERKNLSMQTKTRIQNQTCNIASVVKLSKQLCDKIDLNSPRESEKLRWSKIEKSIKQFLRKPEVKKFSETISEYADLFSKYNNFGILDIYAGDVSKHDLEKLLKKISECVLKLPDLFKDKNIRLLEKGKDARVTLKESQICCLLANAFFCTFAKPEGGAWQKTKKEWKGKNFSSSSAGRGTDKRTSYSSYSSYSSSTDGVGVGEREKKMPTINFNSLLCFEHEFEIQTKLNKFKCIMNYFDVMLNRLSIPGNGEERQVTYHRQVLKIKPDWKNSSKQLSGVDIRQRGTIEDGKSLLQVDFANKLVGGGVLDRGCVQEEIRFVICPELIVSRLITEELDDDECLIVTGIERFSSYKGYAKTFEFNKPDTDNTSMDSHHRRLTQLVAIDAMKFSNSEEQFCMDSFLRELNKAYCGFMSNELSGDDGIHGIATGHWGCGAFKGDKELKFLIQLLATSEASRELCYFTFEEKGFTEKAAEIYTILKSKEVTVGSLFSLVADSFPTRFRSSEFSIFRYVKDCLVDGKTMSSSYRHQRNTPVKEEKSKDERGNFYSSEEESENDKSSDNCRRKSTKDDDTVEKSSDNIYNDFI